MKADVILIAGPTASGKSALALALAAETGGVIVNADSMQVYDVLSVLTARPGPAELAAAPHRLYGMVPPGQRYSTGAWLEQAADIVREGRQKGHPLIFAGGTGLYFQALEQGMVQVPEVPAEVVARIEAEVRPLSRSQRGALLAERDPKMVPLLSEPDHQRVVRALSVLAATGRSLAEWRMRGHEGALGGLDVRRIVLNPAREVLEKRIRRRFDAMLSGGAVEEVERLVRLDLDPGLPAMKAIGVRPISRWLKGELDREQVVEQGSIATRQLAKRQRTWFRRRMADWEWRS
ncbi:MAG TPA: tRNA (adenosine(37)-N6)-dimethylallyltransferase MiaA [Devosia sp.]|nr:tRNA (adenosine(37)-N6)-dimethylallyltransferase MiaA [Devosia sp.]